MNTLDCIKSIFTPATHRRCAERIRLVGTSVFFGMVIVGCEGGSIELSVPEISSSVPALSDDPVVEGAMAAEPELPEVPVQVMPAEGAGAEEEVPGLTTEDSADDEVAPVQVLAVEAVAVPATNVGISTQAQALLKDALARGGVRIMPTGDSITHGHGSASYRRELAGLLDTAGCSYRMVGSQSQSLRDTGYYGAHEGYSGHTADYFLTGRQTDSGSNPGIANVINYQSPDLVLLHIGSVDLWKGQTVESTVADIASVLNTIHQNKPDTVIVVANLIPWFNDTGDSNLPNAIRSLGNRVQELVRNSNNPLISIADVRSGFTEDMMQSDMVHPNLDGDTHIANAIFDSFYSSSICSQ